MNLYGQTLESTNELLGKLPNIVGGKTGYTEKALGCFLLVVEAPIHSGALVTARTGGEQGKDVFVVPGSVSNPNFEGSHKLIRDGAILVSSVEDILEDLHLT